MPQNLTTLAAVKEWLNIAPDVTDSDALLNRIIASCSAFILNYLNRDTLSLTEYTEVYDGYGSTFMLLRNFPVVNIGSLSCNGVPVPPAGGNGDTTPWVNGWIVEPGFSTTPNQRVTLFGRRFPNGRSSVRVVYSAGYVLRDQKYTVPTDAPHVVTPAPTLLDVISVTIAGVPLVEVTGDPAPGEFSVNSNGSLVFNPGQAGDEFFLSYSYVPADIEQAAWELVGARYRYMDRIGYTSKTLGGQETVAFAPNKMDEYSAAILAPYRRTAPL